MAICHTHIIHQQLMIVNKNLVCVGMRSYTNAYQRIPFINFLSPLEKSVKPCYNNLNNIFYKEGSVK